MSSGLYCLCEGGLVIDTSTITGVLQQALTISTANSGTLSYPSLAGRTVFVATTRSLVGSGIAFSNRNLSFNIDYSSGYPVITYSPIGSGTNLDLNVYVLVK